MKNDRGRAHRGGLGVHEPGLACGARVHGSEHHGSDLHRAVLRRGAHPYLVVVYGSEKPQTAVVEFP